MKHCMSFAKGVGTGMIAGIAAATAVKCMCSKNKSFSKRTHKAARAVSEIMQDIQDLLD